jgi:predicted RNA-binding protein with PIN domain
MRYLIDGYNLMHAVWPAEARQLRPRAWPRFRQRLLDRLRKSEPEATSITVVFDSAASRADAPAGEEFHGIHVRFAAGYPSADDLIEELIRTDSAPSQLTVVSDDRRLRDAARRRGCAVCGCLDYFESLGRPPAPAGDVPETNGKPEEVEPDETERWLREFGDTPTDY